MLIAISATFTAEAIQPALAFWMRELGVQAELRFAPYHQVFQELLDPAGLLARNTTGVNILLIRFDDWPAASPAELVDALRAASARITVPLILVLCPGARQFDDDVRAGVAGLSSVYLLTAAEIDALYPVADVHDPHGNELGRVAYTPLYFVALATAVARKIHAITASAFKVIALDCDDTLWAGICGEDGPEGVVLDPPRRGLQEFMAERRREGLLLTLCSKNNEADVAATFRAHPEMPLALSDFAAARVNWESKGGNLASLAEELELGLDTFILVDDNAKEVQEAQAGAPQALTLLLPPSASDIPDFLSHTWAFDRARVTDEDRRRGELYAQRAQRAQAARTSPSLEEFLASLQLEVTIAPMLPTQVDRVAQLTQRTNQMNATCIRRTAAEIERLDAECLTVHVADRFGSYGLTGVIIFRETAGGTSRDTPAPACEMPRDIPCPTPRDTAGDAAPDTARVALRDTTRGTPQSLTVDTFLLSCRALGRGVEHRMVARLGEIALERGIPVVEIPFVASQRNYPAQLFLESLGAAASEGVFRLCAAHAAAIQYEPWMWSVTPAAPEPSKLPPPARPDYARIARDLRTPEQVFSSLRATARRRTSPRHIDPPRTALERDLVTLWAELLNVEAVGIHDNFFELGGHSLLAVQLLSRVRQIYGVDLSLEVVYSGEFVVAELAKAIELKEIEQAGGDYREMIQELEGLSDDEVRALLAEEQDAT